jgi:hypothetical protein
MNDVRERTMSRLTPVMTSPLVLVWVYYQVMIGCVLAGMMFVECAVRLLHICGGLGAVHAGLVPKFRPVC